jgi:hypothetical protein
MRILIVMLFAASTALAQQPAKWRLVEEWRVGGDVDGPHSFADTRGMALLPDGRIAIVDYKDAQVFILDAKGQPIRTVGRKGSGPGEFDRPNGLVITPKGEIVVNDPNGNNRFTILASNGDFVKTVPMLNRAGAVFFTWDGYINAAGRINELVLVRRPNETSVVTARRVWSGDFASLDTIMPPACPPPPPGPPQENLSYEFRGKGGSMMIGIPYIRPSSSFVQGRDGARWGSTFPDFGTISHRPAGTCESDFTIVLRGRQLPIPSKIRDSTIAAIRANAAKYSAPDPDFAKIPTVFPPYDVLYVDQANRLWVNRMADAKKHRFEVYSAKGALLAEGEFPFVPLGGRPIVITEDRILCLIPDVDDLIHLVSLRIVPDV